MALRNLLREKEMLKEKRCRVDKCQLSSLRRSVWQGLPSALLPLLQIVPPPWTSAEFISPPCHSFKHLLTWALAQQGCFDPFLEAKWSACSSCYHTLGKQGPTVRGRFEGLCCGPSVLKLSLGKLNLEGTLDLEETQGSRTQASASL